MPEAPTIGDKIPPLFKPIIQQVVGAIVTAILVYLVGQGLLAPTNQRLEAQTEQVIKQNTMLREQVEIQRAEAAYWAIPMPARMP